MLLGVSQVSGPANLFQEFLHSHGNPESENFTIHLASNLKVLARIVGIKRNFIYCVQLITVVLEEESYK